MPDCRIRSNPDDVLEAAKLFPGAKALVVGE